MAEGGAMTGIPKQGLLFGLAPAEMPDPIPIQAELARFSEFGTRTQVLRKLSQDGRCSVPAYVNEWWTSKQRVGDSLHEVSYRACFKPQLPRFFVQRLSEPGDRVYDPFMGRGTTLLESALLGRKPVGNDINPLSEMLVRPRLEVPAFPELVERLAVGQNLAIDPWGGT